MRRLINSWRALLKRFAAAAEGVAAVEFALILPVMLIVYIGGVEASSLISIDRRVQIVTGSLGDLVSRSNATIPTDTLTNYFKAAESTMLPYSSTGMVQVITSVQVLADGTTKVVWSRQYTAGVMSSTGKARTAGQPCALPAEMINISKGSYVILAETYFTFLPLTNFVYQAGIPLYRNNYYAPRYGTEIKLT